MMITLSRSIRRQILLPILLPILRQILHLAPLLLALASADIMAVDVIVVGPAGSKGQNASASFDGLAGTPAPGQSYSIGTLDNLIALTVSGGVGGDGGDGLAGDTVHPQRSPGAGASGAAANASLNATPLAGAVTASVAATGGAGGSAGAVDPFFDTLFLGAAGGNGGAAVANAGAIGTSPNAVVASAVATGGAGGIGTGSSYAGGSGGAAASTLSAWSVAGPLNGSGSVGASAAAVGGNGGAGINLANGGKGGNAAVQAFSARSTGLLTLTQTATGGSGGDSAGNIGGDGGSASASLQYFSFSPVAGLNASVIATGGNGGAGQIIATGPSTAYIGTGGAGGQAQSLLDLQAARPAAGVTVAPVSGSSVAYGGLAGGALFVTGDGGSAYAWSSVKAYAVVTSSSLAVGGNSGGRVIGNPGAGTASSYAWSNESANAVASAMGGSMRSYLAPASASASADVARTQGELTPAGGQAIATATAVGGLLNATARSSATDLNFDAAVHSSVVSDIVGGGYAIAAYSSANVGGLPFASPMVFYPGADSYASALPETSAARIALAVAPHVAAALAGASILGTGGQGSDFNTFVTSAEFQVENPLHQHILIGFLLTSPENGDIDKIDLSIRNFDTTLVSRSFTSFADAQVFFDDKVLDLGVLPGQSLDLSITTRISNSGFNFAYAIGAVAAAVPESQTWFLLLAGLLVLAKAVRRNRAYLVLPKILSRGASLARPATMGDAAPPVAAALSARI